MSVDTMVTRDTVSATGPVAAAPDDVFDHIRRPANHPALSGDRTVRAAVSRDVVLGPGDTFRIKMNQYGLPYLINSTVKEFDDGRLIAWAHLGGHRWRWEVAPAADGTSVVTETFDLSTSLAPWLLRGLLGMPEAHEPNVRKSVERLQEHFAGG